MTEKASPKTLTAHQIVVEFYNPGDFKEHQKFKDSEWIRVEDAETDKKQLEQQNEILRRNLEETNKLYAEYHLKATLQQEENAKLTKQLNIYIEITNDQNRKLQATQQILNEFPECDSKCDAVKFCMSRICGKVEIWKKRLGAALK